jgi:hypothetical protein
MPLSENASSMFCGISPESRRAENTALDAMAAMAFSHSFEDRGDSFIDTSYGSGNDP